MSGRSVVQMGNDVWEPEDALCSQIETTSLCSGTHSYEMSQMMLVYIAVL